jgi:hypothetical protein
MALFAVGQALLPKLGPSRALDTSGANVLHGLGTFLRQFTILEHPTGHATPCIGSYWPCHQFTNLGTPTIYLIYPGIEDFRFHDLRRSVSPEAGLACSTASSPPSPMVAVRLTPNLQLARRGVCISPTTDSSGFVFDLLLAADHGEGKNGYSGFGGRQRMRWLKLTP